MTADRRSVVPIREIERRFEYVDQNVDVERVRSIFGLEVNGGGTINPKLPIEEKVRQFNFLKTYDAVRDGDVEAFRKSTAKKDNPWEIKNCPSHGAWYHDAFGCMHHSHADGGKHSDLPRMDKPHKD